MLSITSDYVQSTGNPEPYLRRIAEAGYTHVHWCHHWNTDFLYSRPEIDQISAWFTDYGLRLLDLHASHGQEKNWGSAEEYARLAGVELVKNRIDMATGLGGDVIILHLPEVTGMNLANTPWPSETTAGAREEAAAWLGPVRRSLDSLELFARERDVRIAIENMANDDFKRIEHLFSDYGPEFLGLCYDAGHGNMGEGQGLFHLNRVKERLVAVHLHDNDGTGDQHNLLFSGTVDWERLAQIMAGSSYSKCVSMEVSIGNSGITDEKAFLGEAFETGEMFSQMIEAFR